MPLRTDLSEGQDLQHQAYGERVRQQLELLAPALQAHEAEIARYFYGHLAEPGLTLLRLLTEREKAHLHQKQMAYLNFVLSPDLSFDEHRVRALEAGMRHDAVSLNVHALIESYQVYRRAIFTHVAELLEFDRSVERVIEQRLHQDMAWQLSGYMQAVEQRDSLLSRLDAKLGAVINSDDLHAEFLSLMTEVDGVVGACISYQHHGRFQYELCAGVLPEEQYLEPFVRKAWAQESPLWINSVALQCAAELPGRDVDAFLKRGVRSLAVLPILDDQGAPELMVSLLSQWPGYYLNESKQFFFQRAVQVLSRNMGRVARLEHESHHLISRAERMHYRSLLMQGRVEMVYQPIVDPVRGRVVKAEALARLIDEDGSLISPGLFLSGFGAKQLLNLFYLGFEQVCERLKQLQKAVSSEFCLSINLPVEVLRSQMAIDHILHAIRTHGLNPASIYLEVLEVGVIGSRQAERMLNKLKEAGFRVALDDLGTGESSLQRMRQMPIDEIKIDQGFVRTLLGNLENLEYVETLLRLARRFDLDCVVEGVENTQILEMLLVLGVDRVQGYGLARPMVFEDFEAWVKAYHQSPRNHTEIVRSKYGWYARHFRRASIVMDALPHNLDLLDDALIGNYRQCPLTELIPASQKALYEAHREFHAAVQRLIDLAKGAQWEQALEACHALTLSLNEMRALIVRLPDEVFEASPPSSDGGCCG